MLGCSLATDIPCTFNGQGLVWRQASLVGAMTPGPTAGRAVRERQRTVRRRARVHSVRKEVSPNEIARSLVQGDEEAAVGRHVETTETVLGVFVREPDATDESR
jgi:hypothetical protein